MFARASRRQGIAACAVDYARHPGRREDDGQRRGMPGLLEPGGRGFDESMAADARGWFGRIDPWAPGPDAPAFAGALASAERLSFLLRATAMSLGAMAAGVATWSRSGPVHTRDDSMMTTERGRRRPPAVGPRVLRGVGPRRDARRTLSARTPAVVNGAEQ
jgi:hypothetical protein